MKRSSPLRRVSPMKRRKKTTVKGASPGARVSRTTRTTSSRGSRVRDEEYLKLVRQLECSWNRSEYWMHDAHMDWCRGPVHAHHAGKRPGTGLKCSDYETHPFCMRHHHDWHSGSGPFKGWTKAERREWADEQIRLTRERLGRGTDGPWMTKTVRERRRLRCGGRFHKSLWAIHSQRYLTC